MRPSRAASYATLTRPCAAEDRPLYICNLSVTMALGPEVTSPQGVDRLETVKTFAILDSNESCPPEKWGRLTCVLPGGENVFAQCSRSWLPISFSI
jgi:hypothetical protein